MSRKRIIIRNTLSNLGMQVISAGLPFLILPYMLRYWGADTYGLLVLAFSVQTFVQFLNGAISLTSMKYVSEIHEVQDFKRLNAVINVFWVVTFLNNLFVSSVLILMGLFGLHWLNISSGLYDTAQLVFLELGCLGIVAGCFTFIDGVMYGLQRIHNNNLWRVSESLVAALTALAIMHFHGRLATYVFVISLYPILTRMVQFAYLKKSLPFFSLNVRKYFDRSELKRLSGFSAFQIVNQIADILLYNAQKLIVQKGLGSASLTTYEIANKPNLLFMNFISLPLSAILPACSAAYARNDLPFLERMLTMGTRVYLVATLPGIFALIVLMPNFIVLWLGPDYLEAVPVARLFLASLLIACPFKIFSHMMIGKARVFEYGLTKLTYALIGIPVSFYLIGRIGIIGGVLITFGYWLLVDVPTNLYIMHSENISTFSFLGNIAPIVAMLIVEYGFLKAGIALGYGATWIEFFLVAGFSIGAVMTLWFFLVLKREERSLVGVRFLMTPIESASTRATKPVVISVVTVCYNAASTIEVTLRSMATQTYPHVEYLIVDGASTDATLEIVQRYASHITRITSEKDEGIYDAMNKGIGLATGDVVYFLNADDSFVDDSVLADIAAVFAEDASRMLVYGNVIYQDAPAGIVYGPAVPLREGSIHEILHKPFCHQATFARRTLFDRIGTFDRSFRYVADYEWYIKAFKADPKSLHQVDRDIANYFYQGRSYTQGEKTRKEKATVFFRHLMSIDMLWYWWRYMVLRGWKKKLFREQW